MAAGGDYSSLRSFLKGQQSGMGELRIETSGLQEAISLWEESPQGVLFNHPVITGHLAPTCDWWVVRKGSEPFLLWPVALDEGRNVMLPHFSYYFGPMWTHAALSRNKTSHLSMQLSVYETATRALLAEYGSIQCELHPSLLDVRAFDWWNYGGPEELRFRICPRYSASLRHLDLLSEAQLLSAVRELRRREIRRVDSHDRFFTTITADIDGALEQNIWTLYQSVVPDAEVQMGTDAARSVRSLVELVRRNWGFVAISYEKSTGQLAGVTLILESKGVANLALNLTDREFRGSGLPAANVFASIREAKRRGAKELDFNGANSPHRGDDKHSYGAEPVLYFRIQMNARE